MRTILHAILETSLCADQNRKGPAGLRGVVVQWVTMPEDSDWYGARVIRCHATDGKVLSVNFIEPGDNWPQHDPIIISAEGIKALQGLLKRAAPAIDMKHDPSPVKGVIEVWCDAVREDGSKVNPKHVLRVDVPAAGEGAAVPLVHNATPTNIDGVMTPRRVRLGTPPGMLSTGYVQAAQDAVGSFGPPVWWTDGKMALLFNMEIPERGHDFSLVMPVVPPTLLDERWPWGKPAGVTEHACGGEGEIIGGEEAPVVLDDETLVLSPEEPLATDERPVGAVPLEAVTMQHEGSRVSSSVEDVF